MGMWEWIGLPLLLVVTLGFFAAAFRWPVKRPRRADFLPFVMVLFWVADALGGESRPLLERVLKGCVIAMFTTGTLVNVVRWARVPAKRASVDVVELGAVPGGSKAS